MTTQTTEAVFTFICSYIQEHDCPPTIREIAKGCYLSSSSVSPHIRELVKQGRITYIAGKRRTITLTQG